MATNSVKEKNNPNPPAILNAWSILDSSFSEHVGQTNIYVLVVVISGFGAMVVLFGDAVETVVIMVVSVVLEGFAVVASICTVGLAAAGGESIYTVAPKITRIACTKPVQLPRALLRYWLYADPWHLGHNTENNPRHHGLHRMVCDRLISRHSRLASALFLYRRRDIHTI